MKPCTDLVKTAEMVGVVEGLLISIMVALSICFVALYRKVWKERS